MAETNYSFMDLEAQYVDMNKNLEMLKSENVSRGMLEVPVWEKTYVIIPFHIWERVLVTRQNSEWEDYQAQEIKEYFLEDFLKDVNTLYEINRGIYIYMSQFLTFDLSGTEAWYAIYNK